MTTSIPPFLDDAVIAAGAAEAGFNDASTAALRELAARVRANPELMRVAEAARHAVYETNERFDEAVAAADAAFGADAPVLHALYVLESTRLVRERHAARGAPADMARPVNDRHGAAWLRSAQERGSIGIDNWLPWWLRTVASGDMYRLGRLEFIPQRWEAPFRAYTNAATGQTIVLAEAGLIETDDAITGTPISPRGAALLDPVRLARDEWRLALGPGDPVLDIHVPAEGALTIEALRDALAQAGPFFERFYPEQRFVAYVCESWLFSPQLEALLGDNSNIVRWQREGYLLPSDGGADDFLAFTFGAGTIDTTTAPRDTRLRRAVIAHLEAGGALSCGRFVLLREDVGRFGSQPYLSGE